MESVTFNGDAPQVGDGWINGVSDELKVYHSEEAAGFDGPDWDGVPFQSMSAPKGDSGGGSAIAGIVLFVAVAFLAVALFRRRKQ